MISKKELVEKVATSVEGISKQTAKDLVDAVFASITRSLREGDKVQVPGFGSFSVAERGARKGRNPATGEAISIRASKSVRFKAGSDLKAGVDTGSTGPRRKTRGTGSTGPRFK